MKKITKKINNINYLLYKLAGKAEAKKATGLNWSHIKSLLSEGGSREVSKEEIDSALQDPAKVLFSPIQIEKILSLELEPPIRKRVNELEAALIIIGAVLDSKSDQEIKEKLEIFSWYLEYKELSPGSFKINPSDLETVEQISTTFEKLLKEIEEEKEKSALLAKESLKNEYLSNEVVYDFRDGWKVVYLPAAGEMEEYPGLPGTSHDRILEGNRNGLCLGSSLKLYQNNDQGKIYSVRDTGNKPRVTIRISNNILEEAKGKNNNSPDVEGAFYAKKWFEVLEKDGFNYEDSFDFLKFPPTERDGAKLIFNQNKNKPYIDGWVHAWYKQGIPELDKDVLERVQNNDPLIFHSGLGKSRFELVKPVVSHWCQKYLVGEADKKILFGNEFLAPTHEVFKTYRKLPEMIRSAKKLSREDPNLFFIIGLQEILEYQQFSETPIKFYVEKNPYYFLGNFAEKPWAEPYLDVAAKRLSEEDPFNFIERFREKPWAEDYLGEAAKIVIKKNPSYFLENFAEESWAKLYLGDAVKKIVEKKLDYFLDNFAEEEWAERYIDDAAKSMAEKDPVIFVLYYAEKPWAEPHLDEAAKRLSEERPEFFLRYYSEKPWAEPYLDGAAKSVAEKKPSNFLLYHSKKRWANTPVESINGQTWVEYAKKKMAKESNLINLKLLKLGKVLNNLNSQKFKSEIYELKNIIKNLGIL